MRPLKTDRLRRALICILGALAMLPLSERGSAGNSTPQIKTGEDSVRLLPRPVIGCYNLEIGSRRVVQTYLSPVRYDGLDIALSGFWTKALPFNPRHWQMTFDFRANYSSLRNPAGTASMIDLHAGFHWGMAWHTMIPGGVTLGAGGVAGLWGGLDWLTRNGNNPVAADFAAGIGAQFLASRPVMIGRLPVVVSERLILPLASGFFMPEYGETYYEIYLGNHHGLAHFGWPGNRMGLDNLIGVTLDLGRTALQVGYRYSMQSADANHLHARFHSHSLVVGVVAGGLGIKTRRREITPFWESR